MATGTDEVARALCAIRERIAAIKHDRLDPSEAQRQLEIQQRSIIRMLTSTPRDHALRGLVHCAERSDELPAWERLSRRLEPEHPDLPRVDDVSDARVPLIGEKRSMHFSPPDRIGAWVAHALALVEALLSRAKRAEGCAPGDDGTPATMPTMNDLCADPIISTDTFGRIRKAAGIELRLKGAAARNRRYAPAEVDLLIAAVLAGDFIERTTLAASWRKWGSKEAARKPHVSK